MDLRRDTVKGILWTGFGNGITTTLNFVTIAVLAHLLVPADFGLMGMILVIVGFVTLIVDFGIGTAIIQEPNITSQQISTFFYLNIIFGIVLGIIVYFMAFPIAAFFRDERLVLLIRYAAFVFVLSGISITFRTLLQKRMQFKLLSTAEISGTLVYGVLSIVMAFYKYGVLSLVIGYIARQCIELLVLYLVTDFTPEWTFRLTGIKDLLKFGSFVFGEKILNYFNRNLANILIGRFLGAISLGYYTLAYQIVLIPVSRVAQILGRVTYPVFVKVQTDNTRIRLGYLTMIRYISLITFPLLGTMFIMSSEFVNTIYGPRWTQAIILLQIFCVLGSVESIGTTVGGILYSKRKANIAFIYNIYTVLVTMSAIIIGIAYGILGVTVMVTLASFPLGFLWHSKTNRLIDLTWKEFFKTMQTSFQITILITLSLEIMKILMKVIFISISDVVMMTILGTTAFLIFLGAMMARPSPMLEAKVLFRNAFKHKTNEM
jgi:PST family polysaccharide transporter